MEVKRKSNQTISIKKSLNPLRNQLKLIDAHKLAKSLMQSRQRIYEFRDKPGRNLARLLEQHVEQIKIPNMRSTTVELITHPQEKLALFHDFFSWNFIVHLSQIGIKQGH